MTDQDAPAHYTRYGALTHPGRHEAAVRGLPAEVGPLLEAVQGLMLHQHFTRSYGVEPPATPCPSAQLRSVEQIVDRILADGRPLAEARRPKDRFVGVCRHFALLAVAALRAHGVPARARCGFAAYFPYDIRQETWTVEYWNAADSRWAVAEARLDALHRRIFGVDFDHTDVPRGEFAVAAEAWLRCRSGEDSPDDYGIHRVEVLGSSHRVSGLWVIASNLVRDVAALSGMEMLPWDRWGMMPEWNEVIGEEQLERFDELARATVDPDTAADARLLYAEDERLRVPDSVFNLERYRMEQVVAG